MVRTLRNGADAFVGEQLRGLALAHPDLVALVESESLVVRAGGPVRGKVGLVSGGGSGHEPLHAGLVGTGLLDVAIPGPVFTAPTPDRWAAAIERADTGAGVVVVVKNYTGDVLNAEMGIELAELAGHEVRTVLVADDVAVESSTFTAGRRGVAGTLVVEKIAGAAAERGDSLDDVAAVAERAAAGVRSMGLALRPGTVPRTGRATIDLPEDEIEVGVGIHGEPGRSREPAATADVLVERLVTAIVDDLAIAQPLDGSQVLLLTNGLGATPPGELYLVHGSAVAALGRRGLVVTRSLVGSFVTSLDTAGASLSVLVLDPETLALWDAPARTPALTR